MEQVHTYIELLAKLLEIAGVAIILSGVLLASTWFVRDGLNNGYWRDCYERYRANLGRGILLGLELLVGADIIGTITAPLTFTSVGLLAVIILIRTLLSFSLETEIEGCWPWRRREARQADGQSKDVSERYPGPTERAVPLAPSVPLGEVAERSGGETIGTSEALDR